MTRQRRSLKHVCSRINGFPNIQEEVVPSPKEATSWEAEQSGQELCAGHVAQEDKGNGSHSCRRWALRHSQKQENTRPSSPPLPGWLRPTLLPRKCSPRKPISASVSRQKGDTDFLEVSCLGIQPQPG